MSIIGNTVGAPNPRPDWNQTDPKKADYIKNKPTKAADFGAAPSGYGLGVAGININDNLNNITNNGWYCYNKDVCTNTPENESSLLFVECFYNPNFCKQTVTVLKTGKQYTRMCFSGVWQGWSSLQDHAESYAESCFLSSSNTLNLADISELDNILRSGVFRLASDPQIVINDIRVDMLVSFAANVGSVVTQFAISYDGHMQVRSNWYGTWHSWKKVYTSGYLPTPDEIGARPNTWTPSAADVGALPTSGGVMSGNLNMDNHYIANLPEPVSPQDAATKKYVDTLVHVHPCTVTCEPGSLTVFTKSIGVNRGGLLIIHGFDGNSAGKPFSLVAVLGWHATVLGYQQVGLGTSAYEFSGNAGSEGFTFKINSANITGDEGFVVSVKVI